MQRWCLSVSVRLWILFSLSGYLSIITVLPGFAKEKYNYQNNRARTLVQTPNNSTNQGETENKIVSITGVQANPTEKGLEIILQTTQARQLQVVNRSSDNNFIADIPNAQLKLTSGDIFKFNSEKPLEGITEITVINLNANTVRITVTGETALPKVELFDSGQGLIFGLASATSTAQKPQTKPEERQKPANQTPSKKPTQQDETIELIVTGERDGYIVPNATTATRTDTPIRDIPQSIQVVPKQVLEDRNVRTVIESTETVSGVVYDGGFADAPTGSLVIRGFSQSQQFRNGIRDTDRGGLTGIGTVEQIEVLKGPASVLFGAVEPGGIVNAVTKQPLSEPYYNFGLGVGNREFFQPSIDLSGPLNSDKTLLYRFNASYKNSDSFQDFATSNLTTIAPTITAKLGENTDLNLYYEYINYYGNPPEDYSFLLSDGSKPSRSFYLGYPDFSFRDFTTQKFGYALNHQLDKNWQIRNNFSAAVSDVEERFAGPFSILNDRAIELEAYDREFTRDNYFGNVDIVGNFKTGTISHQLLVGFDINRYEDTFAFSSASVPNLDIFNPDYDVPRPENFVPAFSDANFITRYGLYLQDQISLLDNFKVLIGGRLDLISQRTEVPGEETQEQDDSAFSPRIGLVYQPSKSVSLYASYSQSFNPTFGSNPDGTEFKPSKGTQYEAGVKADFLEGRLSTTLAAYEITKTNITTPDPNNPDFSIQVGEQRSRGIELDVKGEISPGWKIIASYAHTNAEVSEDNSIPVGNKLTNVPTNQASLWTTYDIQKGNLKGLGFGLGLFYVGQRQGDLDNSFEIGDYLRTDAAIYYRKNGFKSAINIRNLFNTDYFRASDGGDLFLFRGEPFTVVGSVSWEF
ncbi:MAG: TonB-dependent siderophore receptor [Cyanobacteria bacterium P01_A01_bin.68]